MSNIPDSELQHFIIALHIYDLYSSNIGCKRCFRKQTYYITGL